MKNKKEIDILYKHFYDAHEYAKTDDYQKHLAEEKIIHSLQVIGAGNLIYKNEPSLHNRSSGFEKCARAAYIFHDIGRFAEIKMRFDNPNGFYDHGEIGADMLSQMPEYNNIRTVIAVRHHGHLYHLFLEDKEYNQISDISLKKEIEDILFLAQDADKIANLYLLANQFDKYGKAWMPKKGDAFLYGKISHKALSVFEKKELFNVKDIQSQADKMITTLSWVFDINYKTSFKFIKKHNLIDGVINVANRFNNEQELLTSLANMAKDYVDSKLK